MYARSLTHIVRTRLSRCRSHDSKSSALPVCVGRTANSAAVMYLFGLSNPKMLVKYSASLVSDRFTLVDRGITSHANYDCLELNSKFMVCGLCGRRGKKPVSHSTRGQEILRSTTTSSYAYREIQRPLNIGCSCLLYPSLSMHHITS